MKTLNFAFPLNQIGLNLNIHWPNPQFHRILSPTHLTMIHTGKKSKHDTWIKFSKYHEPPQHKTTSKNRIESLRLGSNHKSFIRRASSSFKNNASFVARLPTIRRHKSQSLHSPGNAVGKGNSNSSGGGSGHGGHGSSVRGRSSRCPRTMSDMNASAENLGQYPLFEFLDFVISVFQVLLF